MPGLSPASPEHIISCQADRIQELSRQVEGLTRELDALKRRLSVYENSNSPPSNNSLLYRALRRRRREERQQRGTGSGSVLVVPPLKKPGRKDGHAGVTQVSLHPDRQVGHPQDGQVPQVRLHEAGRQVEGAEDRG